MADHTTEQPPSPSPKRRKTLRHRHAPPLIPGLPDHIAQLCLSQIHPSALFSVCHSWRRLLYSPAFPPFPSLYTILTSPSKSSIHFFSFDPLSSAWHPLPPPSPLKIRLRHPSFLSRNLPIQSISISNHLVLLAATSHNLFPALNQPLLFNPLRGAWNLGPPLPNPRRWCALGAARGSIYVASGIGNRFSIDVARSLERWKVDDFVNRTSSVNVPVNKFSMINNNVSVNKSGGGGGSVVWERRAGLRDGRFSRDAIDAVGWRGRVCVVNVAAKEGVVYDVEGDEWGEMPGGMLGGWRGPVAAMEEEEMYGVEEGKGVMRRYEERGDVWEEVVRSEMLKGAEQMAARGGRVCVVAAGGVGIVVVDVVAKPVRIWMVDLPVGFEAVAVHILPRMPRDALPPECSSDQE